MLRVLLRRHFSSSPAGTAGSSWIYANKYEEIVRTFRKGKLQLCPSVSSISDISLRMHSSLLSSHVILCEDYRHTTNLLYSLSNKLRHVEPMPESSDIVPHVQPAPTPELVQLSDHLKFKEEYASIRKEPLDLDQVMKEQREIRRYNLKQDFRDRINRHKEKNGFGYVVCLEKDPDFNLNEYIDEGFDVTYVYPEAGRFIKKVLLLAEREKIPYEILPGPSEIISALAASGFPADRFAIEHYPFLIPKDKLTSLLEKRKQQNFTVCFMENRQNLEPLLKRLIVAYGEHQMCFCLSPERQEIRRPLSQALAHFQSLPLPALSSKLKPCILIVAPYAMDYNSELKERLFQINYAKSEIQDEDTPLRSVKELEKKIESLAQKPKYTIDGVKAAHYLSGLMEKSEAQRVLAKLLRVSDREAGQLIEASKALGNDVLQIASKRR